MKGGTSMTSDEKDLNNSKKLETGTRNLIKLLRTMHNESQEDLALALEISADTVKSIENGQALPLPKLLKKIATRYNITSLLLNPNFNKDPALFTKLQTIFTNIISAQVVPIEIREAN